MWLFRVYYMTVTVRSYLFQSFVVQYVRQYNRNLDLGGGEKR